VSDASGQETPARFDPVIHQQHRLAICAALSTVTAMPFPDLAATTHLADHTLSKQLKYLGEAGYVRVRKIPEYLPRGPRTEASLTPDGAHAYLGHVRALRELIGE
jgi:DNA-binding HxlR family transcriptional regulator